ncbi:MAG: phosphatidate cytidylyltransferase [Nitrospira sp.]|nr:phosphatidate cytidylyltransferase [Nitrospira sp.]
MVECRITSHDPPMPTVARRFDARRVYTVLVLAPLLYAAIRYFPPLAFTGLVFTVGSIALLEFYRLGLMPPGERPYVGIGLLGFAALLLAPHHGEFLVPTLLAVVIGTLSIPLVLRLPLDHVLRNSAATLLGILYLGMTLSFVIRTRLLDHGEWLVFFLLLVTWAGDTGAYYAGTIWGQHRLAPRISPKKSVEGLVGGLLAAVTAAYLARWWFLPMLSMIDCAVLALLLTAAGLGGDLAESAMKRSVGAKDSGGVLPGHGGMLDRLDSLLFTAPTFFYYVTVMTRSETLA